MTTSGGTAVWAPAPVTVLIAAPCADRREVQAWLRAAVSMAAAGPVFCSGRSRLVGEPGEPVVDLEDRGGGDEHEAWVPGVLVVDDDEDIRLLLRAMIEAPNRGLSVVGQAATGEEAIAQCRATNPDVVLLDQRMPGMSGLDAAEAILQERPGQPIILFSAFLEESTLRRAAELGIRACMPKGDLSRVPEALWKVAGT